MLRKIILVFMYKFIFEASYILIVSPIFSYLGLVYSPNMIYMIISNILVLFIVLLIPKSKMPSSQLMQLFFVITIIPYFSLFWMTSQEAKYIFMTTISILIIILTTKIGRLDFGLKFITIKRKGILNINFIIVSLIILSSTMIFINLFTGANLNFNYINFQDIYEDRNLNLRSGFGVYLNSWLPKIFIPFLIAYSCIYKNKKIFIVSSLMQICVYFYTGNKTILFSIILIVLCSVLLSKTNLLAGLSFVFSIFLILSSLIYIILNNIWGVALFNYRFLTLPAQISYKYFDFFDYNDKIYYFEGIIGDFLKESSPYNSSIGFVISGNPLVNENTGMLSDAYANMGFIGMIITSLVFGLILVVLDQFARDMQEYNLITLVFVYPIIVLNDGSLLTTLLTGGLIVNLLLIYLYLGESKAVGNT